MEKFDLVLNNRLCFGENSLIESALPVLLKASSNLKTDKKNLVLITNNSSLSNSNVKKFIQTLKDEKINIFHFKVSGEPTATVIDEIAKQLFSEAEPFFVVGIGGGSVLDSAKAISFLLKDKGSVESFLEKVGDKTPSGEKVPFMAIPTTAGTGSEATKNGVVSGCKNGKNYKSSFRHNNFVADYAILDPSLILSLPNSIKAACAMDSISQLLEAFTSTAANAYSDSLCENALALLSTALDDAIMDSSDIKSHGSLLYAAWCSGVALSNVGLGTVHGIAGVIGANYDIAHGVVCGILLPIVVEALIRSLIKNSNFGSPNFKYLVKLARCGYLLNGEIESGFDISEGCSKLVSKLGEWSGDFSLGTLSKYGVVLADIAKLAPQCSNKNSPVAFTQEQIIAILISATTGEALKLPSGDDSNSGENECGCHHHDCNETCDCDDEFDFEDENCDCHHHSCDCDENEGCDCDCDDDECDCSDDDNCESD